MIQMDGASLVYGDPGGEVYAVREASLKIKPGEFVGILGPSGSGKSSLLYLLSGLKLPTHGAVSFQERSYRQMNDNERSRLRRKRFGFVFQQPYLLGYLNALENVLAAGLDRKADRARAKELLSLLGLEQKMHRFPHSLSGGEKQRVAIARALINRPDVIFADEPTASLDHANGVAVVEMLERHREGGAVILVTHDPSMLKDADRLYLVRDGQASEEPVEQLQA